MNTELAVVMPVKNGAHLLNWSLPTLLREASDVGGEVLVVDDASTDSTSAHAQKLGARVLHGSDAGPYASRNLGWQSTNAAIVVFTDVRCRPVAGWAGMLLETLTSRGADITGGPCRITEGRRLGIRVTKRLDPCALPYYLTHHRRPYFPTANLAVRREVLESAGGFAVVRSGGDALFCWDAQGLGFHLVATPEAAMDVLARQHAVDVVKQFWRYGRSARMLENRPEYVATSGTPLVVSQVRNLAGSLRRPMSTDWAVELALLAVRVAAVAGKFGSGAKC